MSILEKKLISPSAPHSSITRGSVVSYLQFDFDEDLQENVEIHHPAIVLLVEDRGAEIAYHLVIGTTKKRDWKKDEFVCIEQKHRFGQALRLKADTYFHYMNYSCCVSRRFLGKWEGHCPPEAVDKLADLINEKRMLSVTF